MLVIGCPMGNALAMQSQDGHVFDKGLDTQFYLLNTWNKYVNSGNIETTMGWCGEPGGVRVIDYDSIEQKYTDLGPLREYRSAGIRYKSPTKSQSERIERIESKIINDGAVYCPCIREESYYSKESKNYNTIMVKIGAILVGTKDGNHCNKLSQINGVLQEGPIEFK